MKCNWRRWLWGIIPLVILSWVAVYAERWRIERDLAERTNIALMQSGMGWAATTFEGRDAVLAGRAAEDDEPAAAAEVLRGVWGVRVVENRAELLERIDNYIWSAGRRGHRIRLLGYAPNVATRQAILGVAKANFPGFEVIDRTRLARGVPAADTWLAGVSFALKQLASLKRGDVRLEGLGLMVVGEAEDVSGYRAVKAAVLNELPKGIKLTKEDVTPPTASPFSWTAQFANGRLVLSGHVPSDAARAEVMAAANAVAPNTEDHMEPAGGAALGWTSAVVASVRALQRLEGGSAEMKDAALVISGLASDDATAEAVRAALRAELPATIKFTDHIQVRDTQRKSADDRVRAADSEAAPARRKPDTPSASKTEAPKRETAAAPKAEPAVPKPDTATVAKAEPAPGTPDTVVAATKEPAPAVPNTGVAPGIEPAPAKREQDRQRQAAAPLPGTPEAKARACEVELAEVVSTGHILFRVGSAELDGASSSTLDKVAGAAKACAGTRIEIGGHASSEGSSEINRQLSIKRAQSVLAYLVRAGVDARRLQPVGYGASRPVAPNDTSENMAKNRRIEFVVRPN
jgi:outer membrane protein OmpA-like peptidoglycan-associated protein